MHLWTLSGAVPPVSGRPSLAGLAALSLLPHVAAQFPNILNGANLTTVQSPLDPSISISYTVPRDVCATAFDSQQQYAGWVSVPDNGYPTNIFFWFVAARTSTSMLSVYLNGGPGSSSMFGMFAEAGPCEVIETSASQLGTVAREWGWDRVSNMLFIDQPTQVGFSYDTPTNGTLDRYTGAISMPPGPGSEPGSSFMVLNGTFSSQDANFTANTTTTAAKAVYHMMQGFLAAFPQYSPPANSSLGVNLFAESYGGHYGPVFANLWQTENARRRNGTSPAASTVDIHLAALGIINGCVDDMIQAPYYASMMVNNTYGLHVISPLQATLVLASFYTQGGCCDLIAACRAAVDSSDPADAGTSASANGACAHAQAICQESLLFQYSNAGRSFYDMAHTLPDSYPPAYYMDYLNRAELLAAIGSPVNFTENSSAASAAFRATGDLERGNAMPALAALLQAGVRIGLLYGDRDFICNWQGGEAVSLALAQSAGGAYAAKFPAAGYAPIIVNDSYIGGVVRQFGNLSFSRIYQAGHFVPAYQPETAFQVFARIILGTDVGTGESVDLTAFNTTGPANATSSLPLPRVPSPTCFIADVSNDCSDDQVSSLRAGKGVVINGAWYTASSNWPGPASVASTNTASTVAATAEGASGSAQTASESQPSLTGVFTATSTPGAASSMHAIPSAPAVVAFALSSVLFACFGAELLSLRVAQVHTRVAL